LGGFGGKVDHGDIAFYLYCSAKQAFIHSRYFTQIVPVFS
jgi:hypothetical protein